MIELRGQTLSQRLYQSLRPRIDAFCRSQGRPPHLCAVQVGHDEASAIYVNRKVVQAKQLGLGQSTLNFPDDVDPETLRQTLAQLNANDSIDGILVQRPLPVGFDFSEQELSQSIDPEKDVDGFHPLNQGKLFLNQPGLRPCTPLGIMALLDHYSLKVAGRLACVVGRSPIVGRPLTQLLLQANATVIQAHRQTSADSLQELCRQADFCFIATGVQEAFTMDYFKPGAVVIDVGIHRSAQGKLKGDVHREGAEGHLAALSPVPGGVGPLTIAQLMTNVVSAAEQRKVRFHSS